MDVDDVVWKKRSLLFRDVPGCSGMFRDSAFSEGHVPSSPELPGTTCQSHS